MTSERRYTEDEVAEILDRATEVQKDRGRTTAAGEGLTLEELKEIGEEAGISPDLIVRAAGEVDRPEARADPNVRLLGARIGVGRTVYLDRRLTDDEWTRLVVDLRETFDARGNVREQGAFRQWNNGNLQALLEPTENRERLRLKTVKGNARAMMMFGATFLAVAAVLAVVVFLTGGERLADMLENLIPFAAIGGAFMGASYVRLPRWADTRERQMEGVIQRLLASVDAADEDDSAGDSGGT